MLKRSTPLKRTAFNRRPPSTSVRAERSPAPLYRPSAFRLQVPVAPIPAAPIEKTYYVRSKKLREAYRLIPCQHCGRDDGTVCCAHSNWAEHGKGKSIKACDTRGASLCFACHNELDQGRMLSREQKRFLWAEAHRRTVIELLTRGLWPTDVAIPHGFF